jgi:hypothetical protein
MGEREQVALHTRQGHLQYHLWDWLWPLMAEQATYPRWLGASGFEPGAGKIGSLVSSFLFRLDMPLTSSPVFDK